MSVLAGCANTVKAVLNKQSMYFLPTLRRFFSWQTRHTVRHWKISNENKFLRDSFSRSYVRVKSQTKGLGRDWKRKVRLKSICLALGEFWTLTPCQRFGKAILRKKKKPRRLFCSLRIKQNKASGIYVLFPFEAMDKGAWTERVIYYLFSALLGLGKGL